MDECVQCRHSPLNVKATETTPHISIQEVIFCYYTVKTKINHSTYQTRNKASLHAEHWQGQLVLLASKDRKTEILLIGLAK